MSGWLVRVGTELSRSIAAGRRVSEIRARVSALTARLIPQANVRERAALIRGAMETAARARVGAKPGEDPADASARLTRVCAIRPMERAANAVDRAMASKAKAVALSSLLEEGRKAVSPTVFYMVSGHPNPAEGHAEYEYALCVDARWRSALADSGEWWVSKDVARIVRAHGIPSLQSLARGPSWVYTRPYCRHRFVPLPTMEVLADPDPARIRAEHPEVVDPVRPRKGDAARYAAYRRRRSEIRARASRASGKTKTGD